jgi:hypothetical protein
MSDRRQLRIYTPLNALEITHKLMRRGNLYCKFFPYNTIHRCRSIEDLLPCSLLLYQITHNIGHFCCVFLNSDGVNFFDSYGIFPDDELKKMDVNRRTDPALFHNRSYLANLLFDAHLHGYNIIYNETPLQEKGTATCGKWCYDRLMHCDMLHDDYIKFWQSHPSTSYESLICDFWEN